MSTTPAESMHDAADQGQEVTLACDSCGEAWIVFVHDGDDVTTDQAECPISGCPGEGEEV
jgi:hypothetical protein